MKAYVKPVIEVVQAAANEKIAVSTSCFKYGSCFWANTDCDPNWEYWSYSGPNPI